MSSPLRGVTRSWLQGSEARGRARPIETKFLTWRNAISHLQCRFCHVLCSTTMSTPGLSLIRGLLSSLVSHRLEHKYSKKNVLMRSIILDHKHGHWRKQPKTNLPLSTNWKGDVLLGCFCTRGVLLELSLLLGSFSVRHS